MHDDETIDGPPEEREAPSYVADTEAARTETFIAGPATLLRRGDAIGRYVVLEKLGEGGMGVVYSAYDPELDRKIAVKVLRGRPHSAEGTDANQGRLVREAQAMARLTHPHVVIVHDVGVVDDEIFVAMEFLDGGSVRDWLRSAKRSWREVLAIYLAAGEGLAAAHEAGLIHRDFKPDNILLGRDGRVRVSDFGLVRFSDERPARTPSVDEAVSSLRTPESVSDGAEARLTPRVDSAVTRTGTIMGTPAYMAPEQHLGLPADARSDQFSFCIAVYEALYGYRPFGGDSADTIALEVLQGRVREPPKSTTVPVAIHTALARGLRASREHRHESMNALLGELRPFVARRRRRRRWLFIAATSVVAAAIAAPLLWKQAQICAGAEVKLEGVWDRSIKASGRAAFAATGAPFATRAWRTVSGMLDDYAKHWVAAHTDACKATRVRKDQSEALLDLRMQCLQRQLGELRSLARVFIQADRTTAERAVLAASRLVSGLGACTNVDALTRPVRPPADPAGRARLRGIEEKIARARALWGAGRYRRGLPPAKQAAEEAGKLAFRPLEARALLTLGRLQAAAGRFPEAHGTAVRAERAALAGGDDRQAISALREQTFLGARRLAQPAAADSTLRRARALLERVGRPPGLAALVENVSATLLATQGRYADAARASARAIALLERSGQGTPLERAEFYSNLGGLYIRVARHEAADQALGRAAREHEKLLGPDHPMLAKVLLNLGYLRLRQGRLEEALRFHRRAATIRRVALGPGHADSAIAQVALADSLQRLDRLNEAIPHYRRALQVLTKKLGPKHAYVAAATNNLASALTHSRKYDEALVLLRTSLAQKLASLGAKHPDVAYAHHNIAALQMERGAAREALAGYQKALGIWERALGRDHVGIVDTIVGIGEAHLALGQTRQALAPLERALGLAKGKADPGTLARARFALARALRSAGRDPARQRILSSEAEQGFRRAGRAFKKDLAKLRVWRAVRRPP